MSVVKAVVASAAEESQEVAKRMRRAAIEIVAEEIFIFRFVSLITISLPDLSFTPLESPAARSGDDGCSFFNEHAV
jgi:hypothetical protein